MTSIVVQSLSPVQLFANPQTVARQASLFFTISRILLKLMSIESVMSSNHPLSSIISQSMFKRMSLESVMLSNSTILCRPLLLLPSIFPSIRVFSNELALCIRWPKYWNFSYNNRSSNDYVGLTSFQINWFDLLAVQGTLKSSPVPKFESIKSSVLSLFYSPSLTSMHDMHKEITALPIQTFVRNVMFLLFNVLSSFVISFPSKEQASRTAPSI